jgi:LmbE family N-acetylglucosaminyl deacetylase
VASLTQRSLAGLGTDESVWVGSTALRDVTPLTLGVPTSGRVVVVAPHPDDEVLGAGGTTALLVSRGATVVLVAVTDGEASAPEQADTLRTLRPLESAKAAETLGTTPCLTHRLGLRDGAVAAADVESALRPLLEPGDLLLAPWVCDGHPDHEQTGLGAEQACRVSDVELLEYLVWAWHWARPSDIPWERCGRVDFDDLGTARKRRAVQCFTSQLTGPRPILSKRTVVRLTRHFEVLVAP